MHVCLRIWRNEGEGEDDEEKERGVEGGNVDEEDEGQDGEYDRKRIGNCVVFDKAFVKYQRENLVL